MATASWRSSPRKRISSQDRLNSCNQLLNNCTSLLSTAVELEPVQLNHVSRTNITYVELKWSPGMQNCPPSPCKYSPPRMLINKKECKTAKETSLERCMHERHVFQGRNFTKANVMADTYPLDKAAELRLRRALHKKTQCHKQQNILFTQPPIKRCQHEVTQTEKSLEELVQRPPEYSIDTQSDLFLERPPAPLYVSTNVGTDASTEKACVEESMKCSCVQEVAHEKEINRLCKKQEELLALRETELAKLRRLEANEMRLRAEKKRCLRQDAIVKKQHEEMQNSIAAAKLLQGHIAGLVPKVLKNLEPATHAANKEQLKETICPWLVQEVEKVGQNEGSREILTVIMQEIIKQRAAAYAGYK